MRQEITSVGVNARQSHFHKAEAGRMIAEIAHFFKGASKPKLSQFWLLLMQTNLLA